MQLGAARQCCAESAQGVALNLSLLTVVLGVLVLGRVWPEFAEDGKGDTCDQRLERPVE